MPRDYAFNVQAALGLLHFEVTIAALDKFEFEVRRGTTLIVREPMGVCGLITPWNFPMLQIACKVAPALAAGCTVVLKPSELAPLSAAWFAEIMHEAEVPKGVFNLVQATDRRSVRRLSAIPTSLWCPSQARPEPGILIAKAAADTIKHVSQELGGKSANVLLPDVDFEQAVTRGVAACFRNSGESCSAPTSMLVPVERFGDVVRIAKVAADKLAGSSINSEPGWQASEQAGE